MKLLFLSNLFPDVAEPYRGLDNACLLHYLSRNCDVRAVSPRPALPLRNVPQKTPREIDRKFSPIYLKAYYVPKVGSRLNHRLFASAIRRPLLDLKKTFNFDVILCSWLYPDACAVARLQDELKVPFVAIAQGSDVHSYIQMASRRETIVESMNRSGGVITRSARLATLLKEAGVTGEKLHPVYNGVDLELFKPGDQQQAKQKLGMSGMPVILFVGNFLPVKNPLLLIRAHAELCRKHPARLVMIGGGPMEAEVRALADSLGFGGNVVLAGRKTAADIAVYMQAADLLCLSSQNEGVPNVILEAFASGLRVVSTNVGGISEVLCHDYLGKLVEKGNGAELTGALISKFSEQPDRERIRNHALNFSWEKAADNYLKILQGALESR